MPSSSESNFSGSMNFQKTGKPAAIRADKKDTATSAASITLDREFQLFMQYAPNIIVGHALDAGYFRFTTAIDSLLEVCLLLVLSLAHQGQYYQVFLAQAVGLGFGQGPLLVPSLVTIPRHFKKRRVFAIGVAVTGASLGGIIWTILLNQSNWTTSTQCECNSNHWWPGGCHALLRKSHQETKVSDGSKDSVTRS
ncbi:hypothetical protein L218DRAFT_993555 [Marasmius fiardii PR-910]|nr:hypothetical protein L218DRAFT_993555 [Marasmius fiardii PR-910]